MQEGGEGRGGETTLKGTGQEGRGIILGAVACCLLTGLGATCVREGKGQNAGGDTEACLRGWKNIMWACLNEVGEFTFTLVQGGR